MSHTRSFLVSVLAFDSLVIVVAILAGASEGDIKSQFEEKGLITWVSFFQLLIISGLSWKIFRVNHVADQDLSWRSAHIIWLLIAISFLYLAIDEAGKIHERLDKVIHSAFGLEETGLSDRLDDLIVLVYGVIGIGVLYLCRVTISNHRVIVPYLVWGFILLFLMVALDTLINGVDVIANLISHPDTLGRVFETLYVAEDSFKLFAGGVFLAGFYAAFRHASRRHTR